MIVTGGDTKAEESWHWKCAPASAAVPAGAARAPAKKLVLMLEDGQEIS